ncbi:MAG: hypothetical protein JWO03_2777 [Bacteroidetes bacterium]|nr:hypothetical protein [Bacteroidota bacterium]
MIVICAIIILVAFLAYIKVNGHLFLGNRP